MTEKAQSGTGLERDLVQTIAEFEYHLMSLGALISCVRYGLIGLLVYRRMVFDWIGGGAVLHVHLGSIKSGYAVGICRLIQNMAVDPMLALVAIGQLTEIDWKALEDQDWFPFNYDDGKILVLLAESLLVHCCASGAKVLEGGQPEVKPRYQEDFVDHGMSMKYGRLAWRRYLADGFDVKAILTPGEQNSLSKLASPTTSAAMADVKIPAGRLLSSPTRPNDEKDWKMSDLVEVEAKEQVKAKCRLRDLQESCHSEGRTIPESVS